jgi:hypothetical protein
MLNPLLSRTDRSGARSETHPSFRYNLDTSHGEKYQG